MPTPRATPAPDDRPLGLRFITAAVNEPWTELDADAAQTRWAALSTTHGDAGLGTRVAHPERLAEATAELRTIYAEHDPARVAASLNAALRAHGAPTELAQLPDGRWATRPAIPIESSAADFVRSLAAAALAQWFAERGRGAWGLCAAPGCERAFIDEGRRAPQRFCSPNCATRTRVAAHRAERRPSGGTHTR